MATSVARRPKKRQSSEGDASVVGLRQFTPDPRNARKHNRRNVGLIVDALEEVGAGRSIVIDEKNVVLAGNATLQAARKAGITRVRIVDTDHDVLVAVRRRGLSPREKTRLALFDNRAAELAEWDVDVLKGLSDDGLALDTLWSKDELPALFGEAEALTPGLTDPNAIPTKRTTSIKVGQLFQLGKHRLLCGDCTKPRDVDQDLRGSGLSSERRWHGRAA